jgi:hypothetical protein
MGGAPLTSSRLSTIDFLRRLDRPAQVLSKWITGWEQGIGNLTQWHDNWVKARTIGHCTPKTILHPFAQLHRLPLTSAAKQTAEVSSLYRSPYSPSVSFPSLFPCFLFLDLGTSLPSSPDSSTSFLVRDGSRRPRCALMAVTSSRRACMVL